MSSEIVPKFMCSPQIQSQTCKAQKQVTGEVRLYLLAYSCLAAVAVDVRPFRSGLLRYWIFPAIVGQPILRGYLLGEHHGRKQSSLIYENTGTIQTNGWVQQLAWNMPYHLEHHVWPSVPFWKLPELHAMLAEQIESTVSNQEESFGAGMIRAKKSRGLKRCPRN